MNFQFFDRDLSWLSFNGRVLSEAGNPKVPLLERIKFLSIFSSNLDEFYRVRMPEHLPVNIKSTTSAENVQQLYGQATQTIHSQQKHFGKILVNEILPELGLRNILVVYNSAMPKILFESIGEYFFTQVAAFLQITNLSDKTELFFSENNQLYQVVVISGKDQKESIYIIEVPSQNLSRFFTIHCQGIQYIVFLEDIIQHFLPVVFPGSEVKWVFNIKITRDADLALEDEFSGDLAEKIEGKIVERERGPATRFLYEPGLPLRLLHWLATTLHLPHASMMKGGKYHNLKDLAGIPINGPGLQYDPWPPIKNRYPIERSIFTTVTDRDIILHTPFESYQTILRFFNEAAIDPAVEEIYVTLYRIASDSRIAHALISAALNGKKVTVFVELKARFDEANNIIWGKKMKAAGARIMYSIPNLKVHAKVALVKRRENDRLVFYGLLSTGNLNETTARFYTDHILLTAHQGILQDLDLLFLFLSQKRVPADRHEMAPKHLLIAQLNMQSVFLALIDNEIKNARLGLPAGITIKLNNLEERILIVKLYEASQAGVRIRLLVRSICCLVPGVPGQSENITVKRIVDRYLEHGRVFIFNNNDQELFFLGSADWMNRNIYSRIEVCFPVYNENARAEIKQLIDLQWRDNVKAVQIDPRLHNLPVPLDGEPIRSQEKIYEYLSNSYQQ